MKRVPKRGKKKAPTKRPARPSGNGGPSEFTIIFEENPQPMWVFDLETLKFLAVNRAAVDLYGYSAKEFLTMSVKEVRPKEEIPALQDALRRIGNGKTVLGVWRHQKKDGTIMFVEAVGHRIHYGGKDAVLTSIVDATVREKLQKDKKQDEQERAKLLAREQSALAEAQTANRAKDEFLALISHELRTPMTAMLGWMWLLRSKTLDEEGRVRALDIIERNMHLQAQIIEDILDVSNIVTGKLRLETRQIAVKPILEAAIRVAQPAADAKRIKVGISIDSAGGQVLADPDRLQQVFWNLLSNAIKFTPENGSVAIEVLGTGANVQVCFRDTGQGIHPEFAPYLFDRFRQGESSITRKHRGLGLGLSLVRDLVELHGGSVRAASEGMGLGATFTVELPASTKPAESVAGTAAAPAAGLSKKFPKLDGVRVLLVEDEPDARDMFAAVLQKCGASVTPVGSVPEAMSSFHQNRPDVLVADIAMPGEDGYALIRKIRALKPEEGGEIPAAALTACVQLEDRYQALQAGYQIYIPKPVDPVELAGAVNNLAGPKRI
ncbi:MAG: response regulator [Elusimicrobia bacterium]|nr:response regulator [Elusimicrobiota bacterium]